METVLGTETLYAATAESLELDIFCTVDPTVDDALPAFALSGPSAPAPSTAFENGVWTDAGWDSSTKIARAVTPLIGAAGTLPIVSGQKYSLWAKVTAGAETPVWIVGTIICP